MFDYLVRRFFNLITLACAGIYAFFVLKSEIDPETLRLQAVGAQLMCDGVPFA